VDHILLKAGIALLFAGFMLIPVSRLAVCRPVFCRLGAIWWVGVVMAVVGFLTIVAARMFFSR
jgi:hypothetical protein